MNKRTRSIFFSIIIGLALSVGLSYVHAAWTDPTSGPVGPFYTPVTALATPQIKPGGLSVNTFAATQNAKFDQQVFFRGSIKGGAPGASNPTLKVGGLQGADNHTVIVSVNGDVRAQSGLASDELIAAQKQRLCADSAGHVVYCPQFTISALEVIVENISNDVEMQTIEIDGTQVPLTPPASYPFMSGMPNQQIVLNPIPSPTTVYVWWNPNAITNQHIEVVDTVGALQCTLIQTGDPTPYETFFNIDTSGTAPIRITAADGPC